MMGVRKVKKQVTDSNVFLIISGSFRSAVQRRVHFRSRQSDLNCVICWSRACAVSVGFLCRPWAVYGIRVQLRLSVGIWLDASKSEEQCSGTEV